MACEVHKRGSRNCITCRQNHANMIGFTIFDVVDIEHALGLNNHKVPYRNQYYTESNDQFWNDLVEKGYAVKGGGWEEGYSYFKLTESGVRLVYKGKITDELYEKLRLKPRGASATEATESA